MCAVFVQKSVERIVWKKKIYFPLFPNRSNFLPCVTSGWIKDYSTFVLLSWCTTQICMMHLLLTFMGMVWDPPMYAQLGNGETPWSHFLKSKYICKQRKSIGFCCSQGRNLSKAWSTALTLCIIIWEQRFLMTTCFFTALKWLATK